MSKKLGVKKLSLDESTLKVKFVILGTDTELDMVFNLKEAQKLQNNAEAFASVVADYGEFVLGG